jgi:hypothetical protein
MKIGVISDTHDQIEKIEQMIKVLNQERVELVIHCGDWVSPFILPWYKQLNCPIKSIFGNNDGDKFRHLAVAQSIGLDVTYEEGFLSLEIDGRKVCVYHGEYEDIVDALVTCGTYDAVFHGHNHIKSMETIGKTLSLNPGTLMLKTRPGVEGASFAIYDTETNIARIIDL